MKFDLAPNANDELITRSEGVVGRYIRVADRSKGRRHLPAKEGVAINRKQTAQGSANHQLEVCRRGNALIRQRLSLLQRVQLGGGTIQPTEIAEFRNPAIHALGLQSRILTQQWTGGNTCASIGARWIGLLASSLPWILLLTYATSID